MGSIRRQESFDEDDDLYAHREVVLEAPTLSSKELARAREEALYVLKNNSPEEAFKIFTKGLKYEVEPLNMGAGQEQAQTQTPKPPTPPATGKEQFQTTVPPRRN
nr:uncharacterized protein LOC127329197 [Lolium perenne]